MKSLNKEELETIKIQEKKEIDDLNAKHEAEKKEIEDANRIKIDDLTNQLTAQQNLVASLQNTVQQMQIAASGSAAQAQAIIAQLQQQMAQNELTLNQQHQQDMNNLTATFNQQLATERKNNANLLRQYQNDNANLSATIHSLKAQVARVISNQQAQERLLRNKITKMEADHQKAMDKKDKESQKIIDDLQKQITKLAKDSNADTADLQKQLANAKQKRIDDLADLAAQHQKQEKILTDKANGMIASLNTTITDLTDKINTITAERDKFEQQVNDLSKKIADQEIDIQNFKQLIADNQDKLDTLKTTSDAQIKWLKIEKDYKILR